MLISICVGMHVKTEMSASVQENKSKHICTLFCLVQIRKFSYLTSRVFWFRCLEYLPEIDSYKPQFSVPEGRPDSSDVSPLSGISGLFFDSIFLILSAPLLFFLVLLLILPSPCFCFWPSLRLLSRNFFKLFLLLEIGFLVLPLFLVGVFSSWEMIRWLEVSEACYIMALVLAVYAFSHVSFLISW